MDRTSKIFVAGHRGLVGSAIVRRLEGEGFTNLLLKPHSELDLADARAVEAFFHSERPRYVFLAAARVGGILANATSPAEFIRDNLLIQTSVIHAAYLSGVERLLFFGSSCLYPRVCPQPMKEEYILSGPMEPSSEAYSIAKLAGLSMCEAYNRQHRTVFLTVIPATLYGPHDNFNAEQSHVLSSLLRRFHEGRLNPSVSVWGTGQPVREFLYVDDLADACLFLMRRHVPLPGSPINVGSGHGITIRELAELIGSIVGFRGTIGLDPSRPDGAPIKVLDSGRIRSLGWSPQTPLPEGIRRTYEWYLNQN